MKVLLAVALLVAAGCTTKVTTTTSAPSFADCADQGLLLNVSAPGGPACETPPFDVRAFEDPTHHCVVTEQRDRVHAPDLVGDPWVLGQWWDYKLVLDGSDQGTTRLVYYADQDVSNGVAAHYMMGVVDRAEAVRHAIFSDNPMLGRIHRVLYSPHESGDHADMFHFPLCESSSWTTKFYGETFTLAATWKNLTLPGGATDRGFSITGMSADGSLLTIEYSPHAQWFTLMTLVRGDGSTVAMSLAAYGEGHKGPAYFLRAQQDAVVALAPPATFLQEDVIARVDGDDGAYNGLIAHILAQAPDGSGTYQLTLLNPAGETAYSVELGDVSGERLVDEIVELPYAAGDWTLRQFGPPAGVGPSVEGSFTLVSVYDRSGTV